MSRSQPDWFGCCRAVALLALALFGSALDVHAQSRTTELFAGDSVRVDDVLIGRLLSIDGVIATVLSREKPRCRAGEGYGDPPICDPAPQIRREIDLRVSTLDRRMQKGDPNKRTAVGGLLGAAVFGAAGYAIGPTIGFGKVDGCLEASVSNGCDPADVLPPDVLEANQRKSDQQKGAIFFGVIGGTATAIFARKLSTGWVRFEPTFPTRPDEPWGLTVLMPGVR